MYQYKAGDACPACLGGILTKKVVTEVFEYNGKELSLPGYTVFVCSKCKEEFVDEKTIKATEKKIRDFQRSVDGLLTSAEIKAVRNKLGKTQMEMGVMLGLGKKSFVRYENGQMTQSKPLDLLLRLLYQNPSLFSLLERPQPQLSLDMEAKEAEVAVITLNYGQETQEYEYQEEHALAA